MTLARTASTPEGRAAYAQLQRDLFQRGQPVRERLLEMAVGFNRYAALIEAKAREKMALAS